MINYEYAELFKKDNVQKQLIIDFDNGQITNNRIYSEAFELKESLCSENELRFGSCEASVLKLKIRNEFGELKNKWITVSTILDGNTDIPFQYGKYKVYSDEPSGDRKYTNITAYDAMYDIINAEMVEWYDGLQFPISMKDFRDSFFTYLGVEQAETTLIQDNMLIEKTIDADSISGKTIITAICELNGVFGHINRIGLFEYISLAQKIKYLHPSSTLYPSNDIYPGMVLDLEYTKHDIPSSLYQTCEYEDYETQYITKLQIRQEQNDIGAISGTGTNCYIVEDNFLVYGKSADELSRICARLFGQICGVRYRPFKAVVKGNPCYEVGDLVNVKAKYKDIEGYILERTIKGIQALKDTFEAKGVYEYVEKVNSTNREVKRLKGKTAVLERTVEMLNSEINDEENGLKSQIKQTAEEISTKVTKGEVISEINQSADGVKIKGEKISLEGTVTANDNFKISKDGSIEAKRGILGPWDLHDDGLITSDYTLQFVRQPDGYWYLSMRGGTMACALITVSDLANITGDVQVLGDFKVVGSGTKQRVVLTKSYNARSLYCYEMPSPIFGDVGHGVIGEDGLCYIDIDQIFFETIDTTQSYHVFLQSYSENSVYVTEKQQGYFIVKGAPNTEFDWELKAKQLDFPIHRLEENFAEDECKETDYVALASAYLNEYEQEVLNYG